MLFTHAEQRGRDRYIQPASLVLTLCTALSVSCSSTRVIEQAPTHAEPQCRNVVVSMFDAATLSGLGAEPNTGDASTVDRSVDEFADAIVKAIQATGSFASVSRAGEPGPGVVLVDGRVLRFHPGSALKRAAIGFGAGSPELEATVRFRAGSDTTQIGSYYFRETAAKGPGLTTAVGLGTLLTSSTVAIVVAPFAVAASVEQNLDWMMETHAIAVAEKLHLACFDEYPADAQYRRNPEGSARERGRERYGSGR